MTAREQLLTFTIDSLPTLDTVVLGALELFGDTSLPTLTFECERPLVLGSGNAAMTGRIMFADKAANFADEATYHNALEHGGYDAVVVVSASGMKHAIAMVNDALQQNVPVHLVTNNETAPAAEALDRENVYVFPKNREPYTYNTSTYLGPIFGAYQESPVIIKEFIDNELTAKLLRNFGEYDAFTFILPDHFASVCDMIVTKFDELFGGKVSGRAFTESEIMHAKTVVPHGGELFISLGVTNEHYGLVRNRLQLSLPGTADFAAYIAASYYVVGKIQQAHPPYFAQNIEQYCRTASKLFGQTIAPIVE